MGDVFYTGIFKSYVGKFVHVSFLFENRHLRGVLCKDENGYSIDQSGRILDGWGKSVAIDTDATVYDEDYELVGLAVSEKLKFAYPGLEDSGSFLRPDRADELR